MSRMRIVAALLCVLAAPAYAQVQGQDYELLTPPQAASTQDKVEVIEFFSYALPALLRVAAAGREMGGGAACKRHVRPCPGVVRQARMGTAEPRVLRARSNGRPGAAR